MSASGHKTLPGRHLVQKSILYSSARHSHRAFHNDNVFFPCAEICLLVCICRITFLCGHETGSHLYPRSPQGQAMLHIPPVINTTRSDQWNFQFCCLPDHCHKFSLIVLRCVSIQFFPLKSQMSSCQRSLCHEKVRLSVVFFHPVFRDDRQGTGARHDRSQHCPVAAPGHSVFRLCHDSGQIQRQPRTGDNAVGTCQHCCPDIILVALCCHHDVDTDDTASCDPPCFFYFFSDSTQITGNGISVKIRLPETDLGSRNDADPTCRSHCSRQTGQADSHTHAPLDHGNICM